MSQDLRFWNRAARLYAPLQERKGKALYEALAARCRPFISGKSVLEVGCGTGQLTLPLCGLSRCWEATDVSAEMIRWAEKRGDCQARFSVADAGALPFEKEKFDVAVMANVLHIMPEPEAALAELRRVLQPDGVLLVPTFVYEGRVHRLRLWLLARAGFVTYHRWTLAEAAAFVEAAGFSVVETALMAGEPLPEGWIAAVKK